MANSDNRIKLSCKQVHQDTVKEAIVTQADQKTEATLFNMKLQRSRTLSVLNCRKAVLVL